MSEIKIKAGDKFEYKGYDWVCLDTSLYRGRGMLAIMSEPYCNEKFIFNDNESDFTIPVSYSNYVPNNYRFSKIRENLGECLLPVIDKENLWLHDIDLTADNGDDRFECTSDYIFILSTHEYRRYYKYIPKFETGVWTRTSKTAECNDDVVYVFENDFYNANRGSCLKIMPACVFKMEKFKVNKKTRFELVECE